VLIIDGQLVSPSNPPILANGSMRFNLELFDSFFTVMRPPYGNSNDKTTKTLNSLGYTVVTWNVDSKDYVTHNLTDEITNYKTELGPSRGSDGGIALEHDVSEYVKYFS
jgi:peptidoglycan/xylan/chitin deacetylase (PgdA/CDA1 family)